MLHSEVSRDKNIEINFVSDARAQFLKPVTFFSILSWTPLRIQHPPLNSTGELLRLPWPQMQTFNIARDSTRKMKLENRQ